MGIFGGSKHISSDTSSKRSALNLRSIVRIFGQSIGPILGGVLTHFFGFHAIFLALTVLEDFRSFL